MSELTVGQLKGLTVNSNTITVPSGHSLAVPTLKGDSSGTITVPSGHKLYAPGSVVQVARTRTSARSAYGYNSDAILSDLNVSITPKFSNSLLLVQWQVSYETDYNSVFRVYRDGGLVTTSGYQGYNENDGNTWSGVATSGFDNDLASTPNNSFIQHFVPANSTSATTLQLAIRHSNSAGSSTFYQNRTMSSTGTTAYEVMVSNAVIWEIAQ